jgi:hypothetical protein
LAAFLFALSIGAARDARVQVADTSDCLDSVRVEEALSRRLAQAERRDLRVAVSGKPITATVDSELRLEVLDARGKVVLDRTFGLRPAECASATSLLLTVLDRFLTGLVEIEPRPPDEPWSPEIGLDVAAQLLGAFFPTTGEVDLRAMGDLGSTADGLAASALLRLTTPQSLGSGRFYEGTALLGVGWQHKGESFRLRVEARAGLVALFGNGYDRSHTAYLPWVEAAADVLFKVGPVLVGPEVGGSPIADPVEVFGETNRTWLSQLRVGLVLALPVWREEM